MTAVSEKDSPERRPGPTVDGRIRGLLPTLTGAERRVAEQVLADPARAAASTISALAHRSGTSLTTMTRFCRALGLPGYAEFRLQLAAALAVSHTGQTQEPVEALRTARSAGAMSARNAQMLILDCVYIGVAQRTYTATTAALAATSAAVRDHQQRP